MGKNFPVIFGKEEKIRTRHTLPVHHKICCDLINNIFKILINLYLYLTTVMSHKEK